MKLGLDEPVLSVGKMNVERDFTDVRDMVPIFPKILMDALPGEVFNLGRGDTIEMREVLKMLKEIVGVKVKVVQDPAKLRKVESLCVTGNVDRARERFGWEPKISIEQSLVDTVEYWRQKESEDASA